MDISGAAAEADRSWHEASETELGVAHHHGRAKPRAHDGWRNRLTDAAGGYREFAVTALQDASHRLERAMEPLKDRLKPLRDRLAPIAATAGPIARKLYAYLPALPRPSTLVLKIYLCNLIGLFVLVGLLLYMSRKHDGLIETKRESLRTQAEIIAAAIEGNTLAIDPNEEVDPDRLLEGGAERIGPGTSDLADLEYPIRPEGVAPTLRGLVRPTGTRARNKAAAQWRPHCMTLRLLTILAKLSLPE